MIILHMLVKNSPRARVKVALVCCQHGDERFGLRLFRWFERRLSDFPGLTIVLANEAAVRRNRRYLKSDLNRAYPGLVHGNLEERLARQILNVVRGADFVLDIHTTTASIKMTPIVAVFSVATRRMINQCSAQEVVRMPIKMARQSLLGHAPAVSLEFGVSYARTAAARHDVEKVVRGLLSGMKSPVRLRDTYLVAGRIGLDKKNFRFANFRFSPELDGYPFLLDERAYRNEHRGFVLHKSSRTIRI